MLDDHDLDAAVSAKVISAEIAQALRDFAAARPTASNADEENFKLLSGFNDLFVAIAALLLFVGVWWVGGPTVKGLGGGAALAAITAVLAWGLAEFFTRKRRMAFPSILFAMIFVGSVGMAAFGWLSAVFQLDLTHGRINGAAGLGHISDASNGGRLLAVLAMLSAACAVAGAFAHWRRFHVPITIALGTVAFAGLIFALLFAIAPVLEAHYLPIMFAVGIAMLAFAMRWDITDITRSTHRSDVAFWLHMAAAPLIVHSIFGMLGALSGTPSKSLAVTVLALYVLMGVFALIVDRRALLVSALTYVAIAVAALFRMFGTIQSGVALTLLLIGGALLILSALWQSSRSHLLALVPVQWRGNLPPAR
ncbi:MAG: hypothetical protein ABSD02_07585 [Steroidobacteraceae bacterium]|jgi:hypothetical protein